MFASFTGTLEVRFETGNREGSGRFDYGACIVEDIFDCSANLVVIHRDDLLDGCLNNRKRVGADLPHGDTVGKQTRIFEAERMSGLEGAIHRIRIDRLNANHANLRHDGFHISSDAGNKPAASDGHEDGCQVARMLPHDFVRDRALTGNH